MQHPSKRLSLFALLTALLGSFAWSAAAAGSESAAAFWTHLDADQLHSKKAAGNAPWIRPDRFLALELAPGGLDALLATAPMVHTARADKAPAVVQLPRPDGTMERFAVVESPVMHRDLEQWLADQGWPMRTYRGTSLDTPATTAAIDWGGPAGFHAMVYSPKGDYFIDPYWQGDTRLYTSYFRRHYTHGGHGKPFHCEVETVPGDYSPYTPSTDPSGSLRNTSGLLRTYRIAVAGTAEYTAFHGGAAQAQAAVTTTINRINMLYERDLSVHMTLVANNMNLIYTNAVTDPYTDGDCDAMLAQNQSNVDTVIGTANYDIGHVFGLGFGGVAALEGPCSATLKAQGCSGSSTPVGDPFDIDLVAHEIGHQFGGRHSWTGAADNCSALNFSSTTAYEPGSGSTIMSYAGICGVDNIQNSADDYFHRVSLDEMGAFINGSGNCASTGGIVNPNEPTANAGGDFTIPIGTPFELTGTGNDTDGDTISYNWEEFDLGLRKALATGDDGVQPIFRSWPSTADATRVFPRVTDLVAGTLAPGETLPATNRVMNFRLTVRDNRAGGGREDDDAMTVTTSTSAGPFLLTSPNGGETFAGGSAQNITWNVASTTGAPINAGTVDILLSADGGLTYPTTLVAGTANDGFATVNMPTNVSTVMGRVKVKASNNIFFDISNNNFQLDALSQCRSPALTLADPGSVSDQMTVPAGRTLADLDVKLELSHTWVGDLIVVLRHVDTQTAVTLLDRPGIPPVGDGCGNNNIQADLDDEGTSAAEAQCNQTPPAAAAIAGRLTPNNPLSAFDGEDAGGTWELTVTDTIGPDTGTLNMWCLNGTYVPAGCPATLTLSNQTLTGAQTHQATTSATLGPSLIVNGTNIAVNAPVVNLTNGVQISGTFRVSNTTTCP